MELLGQLINNLLDGPTCTSKKSWVGKASHLHSKEREHWALQQHFPPRASHCITLHRPPAMFQGRPPAPRGSKGSWSPGGFFLLFTVTINWYNVKHSIYGYFGCKMSYILLVSCIGKIGRKKIATLWYEAAGRLSGGVAVYPRKLRSFAQGGRWSSLTSTGTSSWSSLTHSKANLFLALSGWPASATAGSKNIWKRGPPDHHFTQMPW